ncbi:putative metallophosphoesterase YhaO [Novipirellula aureliae]|uniref:Putative metallophosphoesterase YhaO n=1 Tax=Novipirellula aureliae TaxID=2527966 RepID=A0A5C6E8D8_9BACT|nr:DNA repair exonuclease [Novipirellula aureliae]TWU43736.1 putative metallophosphoesterase YhaO [Novipirellula aureliae]
MFKFIHCADIHLDSPLRGLEKYEGAPVDEIRGAVRKALANLAELAIREHVSFVLIAGDIYDGKWEDHQTGLHFAKWLSGLHRHGILVYAITGNHDAENKMTKQLKLPDNPNGDPVMLSSTSVQTVINEGVGVAIHGRGFADQEERENLVLAYPRAVDGLFNIGILHTSLDGAAGGEHKRYAPCLPADLLGLDYQYWALGHVHTRKHHHQADQTPIVFPGNIQGRHIRETGQKGCELVTVSDAGDVQIDFQPLDVFRFEICDVDATGIENPDDLLERFGQRMRAIIATADGLPIATRVIVSGNSEAHVNWLANLEQWRQEIRAYSFTLGAEVWVEKIKFNTQTIRRFDSEDEAEGAIRELIRAFEEAPTDDELRAEIFAELEALKQKLAALHDQFDEFIPHDSATLKSILDEIQPGLLNRLMTDNRV